MSYTLGLSFGFHAAAAALVHNGTIVSYAAEERFTRQKHDRNFRKYAIDYCLKEAGITTEDLDTVAYHESPEQTFSRVLTLSLAGFPFSRREFSTSMKSWLSKKLWTRHEICRRLTLAPEKLVCHQHHVSHAAQSFLASGFESSAILTIDAVGEWASTGLFWGDRHEASPIKLLKTFDYPHSLGLFYSTMTAFFGFIPMDGECSTMALAAFGRPIYAGRLVQMQTKTAKSSSLKLAYFTVCAVFSAMRANKLTALIPVTVLVLLASLGLFFLNLVSPIAPFVYSLF